jgi:Cdc6-like AAA superfamily ATPase
MRRCLINKSMPDTVNIRIFFNKMTGTEYHYIYQEDKVLALAIACHNVIITGQCGTGKTYSLG